VLLAGPVYESHLLSVDDRSRLGATARRVARGVARAVVPGSIVAWRGQATPGANGRGTRVALTFDDGPDELTRAYLEVLAQFDARATFFVIGERCVAHPELVSAIAAGGHELHPHGYSHRRFPSLSPTALRAELAVTASLLPDYPRRRPLVRPPHGDVSLGSLGTCVRAGFTTVLWSRDSGDWRTTSADDVCAAFEGDCAPLEPGSIVLLHEGQPWTLRALPRVLRRLREAGHDLVTVGELLDG
jgi:peptidoglycan/xylan/chitin deacetylase (PgdA/CDA1 family)